MPTKSKKLFLAGRSLRNKARELKGKLQDLGLTSSKALMLTVIIGGIFALVFNIYVSVNSAVENYKLLAYERERLEDTREEGKELDQEIAYFSSLEYKQRYAYDSLNFARQGEELYHIETGKREGYELEEVNYDPVQKDNKSVWWQVLYEEITQRAFGSEG